MKIANRSFLAATLACLVGLASVACGGATSDEAAEVGAESALSAESERLVLGVANTLDEDTLDLDVGLDGKTARKIVEKRPFKDIDKLRDITSKDDVKKLLAYGQAHGASGDGGAPAAAGGGGTAVGPIEGLGCKDLIHVEKAALEIEWFPPKALYFEANRDGRQYYESVPFKPAVTESGLELEASYRDEDMGGKRHDAKLTLDRKTHHGTFTIDGETFQIDCYYAATSSWEIGSK